MPAYINDVENLHSRNNGKYDGTSSNSGTSSNATEPNCSSLCTAERHDQTNSSSCAVFSSQIQQPIQKQWQARTSRPVLGVLNNPVDSTRSRNALPPVVNKVNTVFNVYNDVPENSQITVAPINKERNHFTELTNTSDNYRSQHAKSSHILENAVTKQVCNVMVDIQLGELESPRSVVPDASIHESIPDAITRQPVTPEATIQQPLLPEDTSKVNQESEQVGEKADLSKKIFSVEANGFVIYNSEILNYFRQLEQQNCPKPAYMKRQRDLTYSMRTILVDWLVEVAEEYKLHTQTLFLTVSFIDRFLSTMSVVKAKLQLLGTASMFIAAKCEEIYPPDVNEFVYITDDTYTTKQVLRMEYLILKVLQFEVAVPTSYSFILYFSGALYLTDKVKYLAMYLCELTLIEGDPYLKYKPSIIACAALAVARNTLDMTPWPNEFAGLTGYNLNDLKDCINDFLVTHANASSLKCKAVFNKYSSIKYDKVSDVNPRQMDIFGGEFPVTNNADEVDDDFQV